MEDKAKNEGNRPDEPHDTARFTTGGEKTADELIQEMLEENRLAQIETDQYVEEVAKSLRTWTR